MSFIDAERKGAAADMSLSEGALAGLLAVCVVIAGVAALANIRTTGLELEAAATGSPIQIRGEKGTRWAETEATYDESIERALHRTRRQPIVFSKVNVLDYNQDSIVKVIVASADIGAANREMQGLPGKVGLDSALLTQTVRASLFSSDSDVQVEPLGELQKTLSTGRNTIFIWRVRPKTLKSFTLTFQLSNLARVDGERYNQDARGWNKKVRVNATIWERAKHFWDELDIIWRVISGISGVCALLASCYAGIQFIKKRMGVNVAV